MAGLEPLSEDYALTTFVWSQQPAKAEQILATPSGQKEKQTQGLLFFLAPNAGLEPATT